MQITKCDFCNRTEGKGVRTEQYIMSIYKKYDHRDLICYKYVDECKECKEKFLKQSGIGRNGPEDYRVAEALNVDGEYEKIIKKEK